jgi:hypothetical protein
MSPTPRPQVTYKGVSAKTQEAVRNAARAMGMSIGAWVEKSLQYAINNPSVIVDEISYGSLRDRINSLEKKMEMLVKDYEERHPVAKSASPLTHTGRIAAEIASVEASRN